MAEAAMIYPPALLAAHIGSGVVVLAAGAGAMVFRKGGRLHRLSGDAFVLSMFGLGGFGAIIAAIDPERITALIGLFVIYLAVTAWSTARNRGGPATRLGVAALAGGAAIALGMLAFGFQAAASPTGRLDSLPAPVAFAFGTIAALAVINDFRVLRRGAANGPQRLRRHIWRMSTALFIASASFFLGQQDEFPAAIQGPVWFVPAFAPLVLMAFWMWRHRNPGRRASRPAAGAAPEPA
jgi:uncharacterized membrane protein